MSDITPTPQSDMSQAQRAEEFELLVDRARDYAIFLLTPEGLIASWNEGARRIMGYEENEILGQSSEQLYTPEDQAQGVPERQLQMAREHGGAENERWQRKKDGSRFYASGIDQVLKDETGHIRGYSIIFRDQTEQKKTEETLRLSEERFRSIVENVTEYAIFTLDGQGKISEWNVGAERILGYRAEEIIGQSDALLFTPEDIARGDDQHELRQADQAGRSEDERWHVRRDGSRFWASGVLMRVHDGEQHRFIKVMRDMTTSKQAEEQRRGLERQTALLAERNRMGQELHDTLAQGFTGIKLQLDVAEKILHTEPQQAQRQIGRARDIARDSLLEARNAIRALRSPLLEESSLTAALQHLAKQMTDGITVRFVAEGTAYPLAAERESDLYHIAQEAVTNALRHSQARNILVTLDYAPGQVRLTVQDDGQGFERASIPSGFGLSGMQERAARCEGELLITSQPGQGTEVVVILSVSSEKGEAPS